MPEPTFQLQFIGAMLMHSIGILWGLAFNLLLSTLLGSSGIIITLIVFLFEQVHPYPPTLYKPMAFEDLDPITRP